MKKISLLAVCLALFCTNAFAFDPTAPATHTEDLGAIALDGAVRFGRMNVMGEFYDKYTLKLPESVFSISAISLKFNGISEIKDFTAYVYNLNGLVKMFEVHGVQSLIENQTNLPAGDYLLAITGKGIGTIGGSYTGLLAATKPVPLPGAALFLGAGFLGLVGLRRRNLNA